MRRPETTATTVAAMPSTPRTAPVSVATAAPRPNRAALKAVVVREPCERLCGALSAGEPLPHRERGALSAGEHLPQRERLQRGRDDGERDEDAHHDRGTPRSAAAQRRQERDHGQRATSPNVAAATMSRSAPGAVAGSRSPWTSVTRPDASGSSPRSQDVATATGENVTTASDSSTRPAHRTHVPARSSAHVARPYGAGPSRAPDTSGPALGRQREHPPGRTRRRCPPPRRPTADGSSSPAG